MKLVKKVLKKVEEFYEYNRGDTADLAMDLRRLFKYKVGSEPFEQAKSHIENVIDEEIEMEEYP